METKVLSSGIKYSSLPESYVRPESERPRLSEVSDCENIPVIDLGCGDRNIMVRQIGDACRDYGFFKDSVEKILEVAKEVFNLPVEEKLKLYSDDPSQLRRLSTSFNGIKETVHNWRDYLRLHCHPSEKYVPEWPSSPLSFFEEILNNYCMEVREFAFRLREAIAECLGLHKDSVKDVLGEQGQHMAVDYYPPRPGPELTSGLPEHTDPDDLTILLQDLSVAGRRVLKDGKWLAVKPCPDASVINFGDQLQALSNCKTKYLNHITTREDKDKMLCEFAVRDYQHSPNTSFSSSDGKIINIQGYLIIEGKCTGGPLNILLDTGSSGSYINHLLVEELKLPFQQLEEPVSVTLANGYEVTIESICSGASWMIQGYCFGYGLWVMELRGHDIVLGTNWMSQFDPVTFDFDQRQITLNNLGNLINLQGVAR